jgi:filamentous hemagglutinin family protein
MTRSQSSLRSAGLLLSGVLLAIALPTQAQIVPDRSLNTRVNGACNGGGTCQITEGASRGSNLFHSFQQFSLPTGQDTAAFILSPAIRNVIVRVTERGQRFVSNINGTIATSNPANFFLLNPNGILFGSGATLNIGGSFLATTADQMRFGDGTEFRTTDPAPLLSVNVPIGLGFTGVPKGIEMRSSLLLAGSTNRFADFVLVGGNVLLDNTNIAAPGQRVELAGIGARGVVGLNLSGNTLGLNLPENLARADITFRASVIDTAAGGGGDIAIYARNIKLAESDLGSGIATGFGAIGSQAGNIALNATDDIELTNRSRLVTSTFDRGNAGNVLIHAGSEVSFQSSSVFSRVNSDAVGNGGNIDIQTGSLSLKNSSRLDATARGIGNAGNIVIQAQNTVSFDGSNAGTSVEGGTGNGGNISIQAGSLFVRNGARLLTSTLGIGDAGNILIQARDSVSISDGGTGGSTTIRSAVDGGEGNGGDIQIRTGTLRITDGAEIGSGNVAGFGNAGNIFIQARDRTSLTNGAHAFSAVDGGIGRAGNIDINTGSLFLTQGSRLVSGVRGFGIAGNVTIRAENTVSFTGVGQNGISSGVLASLESRSIGKAGNVDIQAGSLFLDNGAELVSGTAGIGLAGNVVIRAQDVVSLGTNTTIFSNIAPGGVGRGGNIVIQTDSLSSNGAGLTSSTSGIGDAGSIIVRARNTILLDGGTQIRSAVFPGGIGNGGDVQIETGSLRISNRSTINTITASSGNAGDITIQARDAVSLEGVGSGIATATAFFNGEGGDITIRAGSLAVNNGALLSAGTLLGAGNSGNVTIQARDAVSLEGVNSGISTDTILSTGKGGDITLSADSLMLNDGAKISAGTFGTGNSGNVTIQTRHGVLLGASSPREASAIFSGVINRPFLALLPGVTLPNVSSTEFGDAGDIKISARSIRQERGSQISAFTTSGNGGNIQLNLQELLLMRHGSAISTSAGVASAGGDGGNITIAAPKGFLVTAPNENNDITANAFDGSGGRVAINAQAIYWFTPRSRAELSQLLNTSDPTKLDSRLLPTNDISAISQNNPNLSGTITLTTPDVDPSRGLVPLPTGLADSSNQIAQDCQPGGQQFANSFTVTGRGGLPISPIDPLMQQSALVNLVKLPESDESTENRTLEKTPQFASNEIIEAQGWTKDSNGDVFLVAAVPTSYRPGIPQSASCPNL